MGPRHDFLKIWLHIPATAEKSSLQRKDTENGIAHQRSNISKRNFSIKLIKKTRFSGAYLSRTERVSCKVNYISAAAGPLRMN